MNEVIPRYEFRAFAQEFGIVAERLRQRGACDRIEESVDLYFISQGGDEFNVKARRGGIDVKQLIGRKGELEQWKPLASEPFPIPASHIRQNLLPRLEVSPSHVADGEYSLATFVQRVVRPTPGLLPLSVHKRRSRFTIGDCEAELDELLVNGAAIRSVAVESEDPAAVRKTLTELRLGDYENVNYLLLLKRIVGWRPLPADAWYGWTSAD